MCLLVGDVAGERGTFSTDEGSGLRSAPLVFVGKVTSPSLVGAAVSDFLLPAAEAIPATIVKPDQRVLTHEAYAATLLDLTRGGLVMPTELLAIDAEWRRGGGPGGVFPETEFTAWRLLNAIMDVHKGSRASPGVLAGRTTGIAASLTTARVAG
jgi:hypothetical protein